MMDGLVTGALVTPSIRLVRELGRGGMGSVWIAEHLRLRTQVVIKFIAREYVTSAEAISRFEREASLAAQAKSPHVVQVYDHGISDSGLPYIAMELREGEDLGKRLARDGQIAAELFATWLNQACRGLSRAHAKGIVHRDIKPENIFLCDNDGETLVKVLDFGIAKDAMAGLAGTKTGAMLGTAYYMSPEQTMGLKTVDHRTDLWALGVVTYQAVTGVRPFDGDAIGALVLAITSGVVPPPSSLVPTLAPALDGWMARALSRDPGGRFGSAREMADAFTSALYGGTLPTQASGAHPRATGGYPAVGISPSAGAGPGIAPIPPVASHIGHVETVRQPWAQTPSPERPVERQVTVVTSPPAHLTNSTMVPSVSSNELPAGLPRRSRGAPIVVAAAAVVLLAGGGWFFRKPSSTTSAAPSGITATATATTAPPPRIDEPPPPVDSLPPPVEVSTAVTTTAAATATPRPRVAVVVPPPPPVPSPPPLAKHDAPKEAAKPGAPASASAAPQNRLKMGLE